MYYKLTGQLMAFSEQNLVDCVYGSSQPGCKGGWMGDAFVYIQRNGINSNATYPYLAIVNWKLLLVFII